jgi:CRISPR-associated endoribonuclease Cas6
MRIELTLAPEKNCAVPLNYYYAISAVIYKILSFSSHEYATWLHDKGYMDSNGKPRKLFNFSSLKITPKAKLQNNSLIIPETSQVTLFISSPLLEDFIQNFVQGIFLDQKIAIRDSKTTGRFNVSKVFVVPKPEFKENMKYQLLSPLLLSTMIERNGKLSQYYLRADDNDIEKIVRQNILHKYEAIHKKEFVPSKFVFNLDQNYIKSKGGANCISKLITINKGKEETKVKAFIAPFTLETDIELHELIYECGIGEKNSQGFGMVKVREEKKIEGREKVD